MPTPTPTPAKKCKGERVKLREKRYFNHLEVELKRHFRSSLTVLKDLLNISPKTLSKILGIKSKILEDWENRYSVPQLEHWGLMHNNGINLNFFFNIGNNLLRPPEFYDLETVGHRITYIRRAKGITEFDLSSKSRIKFYEIIKIERLKKKPTKGQIKKISASLEVPFEAIWDGGEHFEKVDNKFNAALDLKAIIKHLELKLFEEKQDNRNLKIMLERLEKKQ